MKLLVPSMKINGVVRSIDQTTDSTLEKFPRQAACLSFSTYTFSSPVSFCKHFYAVREGRICKTFVRSGFVFFQGQGVESESQTRVEETQGFGILVKFIFRSYYYFSGSTGSKKYTTYSNDCLEARFSNGNWPIPTPYYIPVTRIISLVASERPISLFR